MFLITPIIISGTNDEANTRAFHINSKNCNAVVETSSLFSKHHLRPLSIQSFKALPVSSPLSSWKSLDNPSLMPFMMLLAPFKKSVAIFPKSILPNQLPITDGRFIIHLSIPPAHASVQPIAILAQKLSQ